MIVIQTAADSGFMGFLDGIGGSLLVAVASIATILISNGRSRKIKRDELRESELKQLAEAIVATRKTTSMIDGLHRTSEKSRAQVQSGARIDDVISSPINDRIAQLTRERRDAEGKLMIVTFTNQHKEIRKMTDDLLKKLNDASYFSCKKLVSEKPPYPLLQSAEERLDVARRACEQLQIKGVAKYHSNKGNDGSIGDIGHYELPLE